MYYCCSGVDLFVYVCFVVVNRNDYKCFQAESGGPLTVIEADGNHTQVGIVSFLSSAGCVPATNRPSVFNRVSFYLDWIAANTNVQIADDFVF